MSTLVTKTVTLDASSEVTALTYTHSGKPTEAVLDLNLSGLVSSGDQTYTIRVKRQGVLVGSVELEVADGVTAGVKQALWSLFHGEHTITVESTSGSDTAISATINLIREREVKNHLTLTSGPRATTKRIGAIAKVSKSASVGEDVDFALTGQTTKTETVVDNFNNDDTATFTGVSTYFDVPVDTDVSTLTLTVTASSGSAAVVQDSVLVDADSEYGAAIRWYDSAHCSPTAIVWEGRTAGIVSEVGKARRHLSVDGQPWGELFSDIPSADREGEDKYHTGSALAVVGKHLVALMTDHNQRLYMTWGTDSRSITSRDSYALSLSSEETTYVDAMGTEYGTLYVQTRNQTELILFEINGFDEATLTITKHVLCDFTDTHRPYPRGLTYARRDDGSPLIIGAAQLRDGTKWENLCVYVFDPQTRLIYNARGQTNNNTANGTSGTPKVANNLWQDGTYSNTNVLNLIGGTTGNRYQSSPAVKVREWNATTKRLHVFGMFADTSTSSANSDGVPSFRTMYYNGVDRYVSAAGDDPFELDGGVSFRHTSLVSWISETESGLTAEIYVGVLESAFNAVDNYNQFGAKERIRRVTVACDSVSSNTDLENAVRLHPGDDIDLTTDWAADIRKIEGSNGVIIGEAIEGTHISEVLGASRLRRLGVPKRSATDGETAASKATSASKAAVNVEKVVVRSSIDLKIPAFVAKPTDGTRPIHLNIFVQDDEGNLTDADGSVTLTVTDPDGGTVPTFTATATNQTTGHYLGTITLSKTSDAPQQLRIVVTAVVDTVSTSEETTIEITERNVSNINITTG